MVLDDRYRLDALIAQGGMGQVFRAHDVRLQRDVAVKIMLAEVAANPRPRAMFRREVEIMASLRHPNVVGVHDSGAWGFQPYLVMPFLEGTSLRTWATRRSGPPVAADVAIGIVGQVCAGVSAMHHAGIIHGDIKPENIIVSDALEAVLVDLGLSQRSAALEVGPTTSGTPGFMAPELIESGVIDPAQAAKIDTYSLGVTAYWLLAGRLPWDVSHGQGMATLMQQLLEPPARPSQVRPELGSAFDEPLRLALHREPTARPTVAELRELLLDAARRSARSRRFIVVLDDDVDMLELVETVAATAAEDAEIVGVRDPHAALSIIESRAPDLLVTDLQMPRVNGVELVAMLRGNPMTADVPVIVISGAGGADEWRLLHALGAECLLHKPLRPAFLREAIRYVLERDEGGSRG